MFELLAGDLCRPGCVLRDGVADSTYFGAGMVERVAAYVYVCADW
jgi:hypothetical protein